MMSNAVDLIVLDLDETLFDHSRVVSKRNRDAIQQAQKAGIPVTICTARMHPAALFEAAKAGIDGPIAVCNGAYLWDRGQPRRKRCMTPSQVDQICSILDPLKVPYFFSTVSAAIANDFAACGAYYTFWHIDDTGFDAIPLVTYQTGTRIVPAVGEEALRLTVVSEDSNMLERVYAVLSQVEGIEPYQSWYNNIEAMAPGGKALGIESLCAHFGVDPARVMAIGDSDSDVSMLRPVGFPVAVENASPGLKAVARHILPHCKEDGVAFAIETIALGRTRA